MLTRLTPLLFLLVGLVLALSACENKQAGTVEKQTPITVDEVTLPSFDLLEELNVTTEDLIVLDLGDLDVASFDTGARDYVGIIAEATIDVSDLVDESVSGQ